MRDERDMSAEKQTLKDKLMVIILLETAKDYKEMDSDLVTECVDFLMELEGIKRLTKEEIEQRVNAIPFKDKVTALNSYAKKKVAAKRIAIIAAVLAVLITLFGLFAIASGDTFSEFFRQMGDSIYELLDRNPMDYENITLIKPNETKTYSSIEDLVKDEEIEILYPTWLPENEKIVKVLYVQGDEFEPTMYVMQCGAKGYGIDIVVGNDLSENLRQNCTEKEIAGYSIYYETTKRFA